MKFFITLKYIFNVNVTFFFTWPLWKAVLVNKFYKQETRFF